MLYTGKNKNVSEHSPLVNNDLEEIRATKLQIFAFVCICFMTVGLFYIYKVVKNNTMFKKQIKINQNASNIDVQLEKRFATLTKLIDAVSSQAKFDKDTLLSITKFRANVSDSDLNKKGELLDKISKGINVAFEAYPELGADKSFKILMTEASIIEKEIAAARRLYNSDVTIFNSAIYTFPSNVAILKKGYKAIPLFVTSDDKRSDVELKLKI